MIITLTLNPALDKTAELDVLEIGALNRLQNITSDAGGKGINVSKMIAALGGKSLATGFIGGKSGQEIIEQLNKLGIENDFINISQNTRTNLKVIDKKRCLTELNEPGPCISQEEIDLLKSKVSALAKEGNIFVFSGSIPKGVSDSIYAELIRDISSKGKVFLDADSKVFKNAVNEKPDFIKPNLHELSEFFGIDKEIEPKEAAKYCLKFLDMGIKTIALTLGGDGAMFFNADESYYVPALKVEVKSTVGAGDSFVGAFAYAVERNMNLKDTIALAIAASAGAVTTVGTNPPSKELTEQLLRKVELQNI
jgi:1-phosphofructokinase